MEAEFGDFPLDADALDPRLLRQRVAERDALVIGPQRHMQDATGRVCLLQFEDPLIVVVANPGPLAADWLPCRIMPADRLRHEGHPFVQRSPSRVQPKPGLCNHRATFEVHAVAGTALRITEVLDRECCDEMPVRRLHFHIRAGQRGSDYTQDD